MVIIMSDKYATKEECVVAHNIVTKEFVEVHKKLDYMTGKLDGLSESKTSNMTTFGIIGAYIIALINMLK